MVAPHPCLEASFAASMDRLGPYEPSPAIAVAVSGGADSMALAILARDWVLRRDGALVAFVVDHGLRMESPDEARITVERLLKLRIPAEILPLSDLKHGAALAERARIRRYEALTGACRQAGILHLLLGHHAADQVETLAMRVLRSSQTHGLAGMPAVRETSGLRLLRPLLEVEPGLLRDFLTARGIDWVEDPSNADTRALRARLRAGLGSVSVGATGLIRSIAVVANLRAREEAETAAELANRALVRPEGFALLSPGRIGAAALRSLVQAIGGASYSASPAQIRALAAQPGSATVAGVRIMPAGRLGEGWLLVREEAAIAAPASASNGVIWDQRFRLVMPGTAPSGAVIGKLGSDATGFRGSSVLPSVVLRTVPAIRVGKVLAAVPHLGYVSHKHDLQMTILFSPPRPLAGPAFLSAS